MPFPFVDVRRWIVASIRHYSQIFVSFRHYSSLFVTIRDNSSSFVKIRHYSEPYSIRRYILTIFVIIRKYSYY